MVLIAILGPLDTLFSIKRLQSIRERFLTIRERMKMLKEMK